MVGDCDCWSLDSSVSVAGVGAGVAVGFCTAESVPLVANMDCKCWIGLLCRAGMVGAERGGGGVDAIVDVGVNLGKCRGHGKFGRINCSGL